MASLPMPFSNPYTYDGHGGMDYPQARNTPVRAEGAGVIDFDGYYSARGGFAKFISFDNGERRGYYHFDNRWGLTRGDRVTYGDVFARVGSLGQLSTGPHLHHEVWVNGTIIKPPAYWDHVDRTRYVGDGSGSGGGSIPFPIPEEDDMPLTPDQAAQLLQAKTSAENTELLVREIRALFDGAPGQKGLTLQIGEIHQAIFENIADGGQWDGMDTKLIQILERLE